MKKYASETSKNVISEKIKNDRYLNTNVIERVLLPSSLVGCWFQFSVIIFALTLLELFFAKTSGNVYDNAILIYGVFGAIFSLITSVLVMFRARNNSIIYGDFFVLTRFYFGVKFVFYPIMSFIVVFFILNRINGNVDGSRIFAPIYFLIFIVTLVFSIFHILKRPKRKA